LVEIAFPAKFKFGLATKIQKVDADVSGKLEVTLQFCRLNAERMLSKQKRWGQSNPSPKHFFTYFSLLQFNEAEVFSVVSVQQRDYCEPSTSYAQER
jgi:hypothetical protein